MMKFIKYHALGNDYLVIPEGELDRAQIQRICHRNYGIGSDGILFGRLESEICNFGLRIFNPDGSEAEKSGNGLRIFARYLWDEGLVRGKPFTVETLGGEVTCQVDEDGRSVTVEMGKVSFNGDRIPVRLSRLGTGRGSDAQEFLRERIRVDDQEFEFCVATIGNPHCVVLCDDSTPELARRYGPLIEADARFPNRTNVQFMQVLDRSNIRIEIWERGAGYTLASGSSSVASAAVAYRLGLCEEEITVHVPGGELQIRIGSDFSATLRGSVTRVCSGVIDREIFEER